MKLALTVLAALISAKVYAVDESYQSQNIVGNWKTVDQVLPEERAVQIAYDPGPKTIIVTYCDDWILSMEKVCKQVTNWKESGPYSADVDGFKATFGSLPKYVFRVDPSDKDTLTKVWGSQSVQYYRIK